MVKLSAKTRMISPKRQSISMKMTTHLQGTQVTHSPAGHAAGHPLTCRAHRSPTHLQGTQVTHSPAGHAGHPLTCRARSRSLTHLQGSQQVTHSPAGHAAGHPLTCRARRSLLKLCPMRMASAGSSSRSAFCTSSSRVVTPCNTFIHSSEEKNSLNDDIGYLYGRTASELNRKK